MNGWYAMRSSDINNQYYNPAITYAARVNANGSAQTNPLIFVHNQDSGKFSYTAKRGDYSYNTGVYAPQYEEFQSTPPASDKKFTYVRCGDTDCTSAKRTVVNIGYPAGAGTIALPPGHQRRDCGANATSCSAALELKNILNWYYWYRTRMDATSTAVGQAMQSYDNKFRVGYIEYNTVGTSRYRTATSIVRGVRYFRDDAANASNNWKTQFYDWLYGVVPAGGTPSHNALWLAADYYSNGTAGYGNPWKNDPTSTAAENNASDLSCRRAYSIMLSDGAWNAGSADGTDKKYANIDGLNASGAPAGNQTTFQYKPAGASGWNSRDEKTRLAARSLYVPYTDGGVSSNGLADLTARFFWHTDFSRNLANNVPPEPGQHNPTFWQNMTTYTIGWGLTPSGDAGTAGGLTWDQINTYTTDWLAGRSTSAPARPRWADGESSVNLNSSYTSDALRVNDFIRAGYTGGGKAYGVYSGDDVRRAIDNALSSMVGAGNDAGVAVSGNSGEFQTLENQLKYTTEYNTSDNSGDVKAFRLDSNGGYAVVDSSGKPVPEWSANRRMPAVASRQIFTLSGYDANAPSTASALRRTLNHNTTLSSLPSDFIALLNANNQQKTDETFVRYLLGQDGLTDVNGLVYRTRSQPIGASVNSPPAFVGGRIDMGYDRYGAVAGKDHYKAFLTRKRTLPATIFTATNNGKVHVLNAAKTDTELNVAAGSELGAFMPKSAMAAQIDLASPAYRFRYVLDGPLADYDVYDSVGDKTPGSTEAGWRQLVFGTGGRAGRFMYGLQSPMNATHRIPSSQDFLWELDHQTGGYGDLGYVSNTPTAGQLDDGTWVMLSGSGHYAGAGKKVGLYVTDAFSGKLIRFIALPDGYSNSSTAMTNRGLGGVVAVRDTSRKIVAAYAGDANGNLWRFDLRTSKFAVSYNRPLFTTPGGKRQPIYATPAWQTHPGDGSSCQYGATTQCGTIVVFGTGILLDDDDLATPATRQALFGIWDRTPVGGDDVAGAQAVTTADLVEQTIDLTSKKDGAETGHTFYQVSSNRVDWAQKRGWTLRLGTITFDGAMPDGERVVGDLSNLGSSVLISSFLPEAQNLSIESCTATGSLPNILYLIDALTGQNKLSFDVNLDGTADNYSVLSIAAGGYTRGNMTSRNVIGLPNEGQVDLKPQPTCTDESGFFTGVGGTVKGFDACPMQGWRRSWRQIVRPPF